LHKAIKTRMTSRRNWLTGYFSYLSPQKISLISRKSLFWRHLVKDEKNCCPKESFCQKFFFVKKFTGAFNSTIRQARVCIGKANLLFHQKSEIWNYRCNLKCRLCHFCFKTFIASLIITCPFKTVVWKLLKFFKNMSLIKVPTVFT
jgi:hypothetical protein